MTLKPVRDSRVFLLAWQAPVPPPLCHARHHALQRQLAPGPVPAHGQLAGPGAGQGGH